MPKPITIPKEAASDVPPGLCNYELQKHLGVNRPTMKLWCFYTGYEPIDGRSLYGGQQPRKDYRSALEAGIGKTLEEVGKELGITRERVRQLYEKHGIERQCDPHALHKNQELVDKIKTLTEKCPTLRAIADASGLSIASVGYILRRLNIPFKNARKRRNEEEAATGLRVCSKCHQSKPLSEYYRMSDRRGGRLPDCKECHYHYVKDWKIRTGRQFKSYGRYGGKAWKPYDPVTDLPWPHGYKQCNVCKKVKLWDEFHRMTKDRTGHVGYCKECKRIADANRPKVMHEPIMVGDKLCYDCDKAKPIVEFAVTRSNPDGRSTYCKACLAIRAHNLYLKRRGMKPTRVYRKRALKRAAKPTGRVYNSVDELVAEMPAPIQKKYHELGQQFGLTAEQINKLKEGKV